MGTRIEKDTSVGPSTGRFPSMKNMTRSRGDIMSWIEVPEPKTGTITLRARFSIRNIAKSFSPLVIKRLESLGSAAEYFERYTWEIMNPLMKMNEGVRN